MMERSENRRLVRRAVVRSLGVVVVLFSAYFLLPFRGDRAWLGVVVGLVLLALIIPMAVHRLHRVLSSDRPAAEAAEALVQLATMLITGFAAVVYFMNSDGTNFAELHTRLDGVYFTVTTLATVGYGDVHATSQTARAVVTVQMVLNLLFLGVAVRVFIGAARLRAGARSAVDQA